MLNYLGMPVAGVDARRRNRSDDRARALADAGAVRRLGRVLPVRAVPVPQRREPEGELRRREGQDLEGHRSRRRHRRSGAAGRSTRFRPGRSASRRFRPRARRSSCAWSASSSRGTSTIPGPTASSAAPTSSWSPPTTRSASIARDPDAKDDITTINQLNLPVDRPVLVHLSSKDVIHSFGLYEMRVKQDAIPGHDIPVWFIPNRDRRLRDRLLAAVRPRPLPDARLRHRPERGRLQKWIADQEKELTAATRDDAVRSLLERWSLVTVRVRTDLDGPTTASSGPIPRSTARR